MQIIFAGEREGLGMRLCKHVIIVCSYSILLYMQDLKFCIGCCGGPV